MYLPKNQKKLLFILIVFVFSFLFVAQGVIATGADDALSGLNTTAQMGFGDGTTIPESITKPISEQIGTIIGALLAFIGVIFFILMIYGGFLWMTAQGNEEQITKAKNLIIAAVIGIIIVMSAYAITAYIGGTLTGGQT